MNKDLHDLNLTPNVRTIGLAGGTGDGKSEITSTFAAPKAKSIISKGVGDTNSTLEERIAVYTEALEDQMILAVKIKDSIFNREDFNNLISNNISKIVREYGKIQEVDRKKLQENFAQYLKEDIKTKVNSRAVLNFLNPEFIEAFIQELVDLFSWESFFSKYSYQIYNTVRNNMKNIEVKDNSAKFISAIKNEVEKTIDSMDKERMWNVLNKVNDNLKETFFKYFSEDHKSLDGYYYHIINLNNQDKSTAVIDAMFSSNDLRKGDNLSIEVLCKEIVIYAPIHKKILELIKSDEKSNKVFMGKDGTVSVGVYDTKGLYHENSTDEGNLEYLTKLLYSINYDALMLVSPLSGDSNEAKLRELYKQVMEKYNKQVPIFILNNKVDLFIDSLYKELSSDDPLSLDISDEEISFNEIKDKVNSRMETIKEELQRIQHKNRKDVEIISLPCYLKKDNRMSQEMLKEYNALNAIEVMIKNMAEYLEASSEKIHFSLSDIEISDIQIEIDENKLKNIIKKRLNQKDMQLKVLNPAEKDRSENIGKIPHGNAYNALSRRLAMGYGYTSNIDENYFYNCHSFSVNFPAMLRNFISEDLIVDIINTVVSYKGGFFKDSNGEEKLKEIGLKYNYFNKQAFVAEMVYNKALLSAERVAFSYGARFNAFLDNTQPYFNINNIDMDAYSSAITSILSEALMRTIDLHILYT